MANVTSKTKPLGIRITHTQSAILRQPKYAGKISAIVRVLLTLYLNSRLSVHNIEELIANEISQAETNERGR